MLERLLRHPIATVLAALIIAIGGIAGLRGLPVDLFPSLDYPLINVVTHYPAGTAADMEQLVTRPIENAMLGLVRLRRVRSISAPGFSQVTIEFTWGMSALQARQLVYGRLAQVRAQLPPDAAPELENIGTSLAMLSTYTLSGGDPVAVRGWAQYQLAPRLAGLPGVARIEVMGGGVAAWRVDLDPVALRQAGLSSAAVAAAIRAANVLDTGGYLEQQGRDLLVRTDGRLLSLDDLREVVVKQAADQHPLRLADIARVYAGAEPQRYVVAVNRLPAVALTVQKQVGASTLAVSNAVDTALAKIALPAGVRLSKLYDQAEIIGLAYRNMRNHLISGALLAILVVLFVLGRNRSSVAIALTFPLTVLGTFWVMHQFGLGLNLMTLGAMTVAIGMVADDSIVVLENIDRHRGLGQPPWQAALLGTREILSADLAGTLTVLAAFAPLVLVGGLAGRLFHPFGLSFSLLLLFSLLLSLTLIPLAGAHWMRPVAALGSPRPGLGARLVGRLERGNLRLLDHLLRHRALTLWLAGLLLLVSLALLAFNPLRLLPLLDENSLLLSYGLAPGTSLRESNRVGDRIEADILALPGVKAVFRRTGSPESSYYIEAANEGELVVRLDARQHPDALTVKRRLDALLAAMPGVIGRVNEPTSEKLDESFSGLPALFGITVYGRDLDALYQAAARIESAAKRLPGISNVVNNTKVPVDQLRVRLDPARLAQYGVSAAAAAAALHRAVQGERVSEVLQHQQPLGIYLRFPPADRDRPDDLTRITVLNDNAQPVPLGQLADIERSAGHPSIEHQRGLRTLTLSAEIEGNPLTVISDLDQAIAALQLPAGIQVGYTGEYGQLIETGTQLLWVLLGSVVLVFGIIALQLGNLIDPLVVLVKLPLDFMGAALALFLTQQALDLTVFIGFITLVGVSVNNGIMLLTFAGKQRREGLDAVDAIREAARLRTRPMLLTHLTTLLALIPAAIGLGDGPQLLQPLGIMLFGGLTAGTLFTLNLLPVIYVATERWRRVSLSSGNRATR